MSEPQPNPTLAPLLTIPNQRSLQIRSYIKEDQQTDKNLIKVFTGGNLSLLIQLAFTGTQI